MVCKSCSTIIPTARFSIGYTTCLPCGEKESKKRTHTIAPAYNKGAYQVITNSTIKDIGR